MIRAVIFYMFETLITHYKSPLYFGAQMAADAGIPEKKFLEIWRPAEDDRTLGKLTLEELLERILRANERYAPARLQELSRKRRAAKEECFRHLHPEIIPMLIELRKRGVMVGLISNCFSEEAEVIRESILYPYFDAVCLSCELGMKKPDEAIFRQCTERLGVSPWECLYVGDGGSRELETAEGLGMKAVQATWYLVQGSAQPAARKPEFDQARMPLAVLAYAEGAYLSEDEDDQTVSAVARIQLMEQYLDEVLLAHQELSRGKGAAAKLDEPDERGNAALATKAKALAGYYESGLWLEDYERDERGELPAGLKRGVLSQDTLYNLLEDLAQQR